MATTTEQTRSVLTLDLQDMDDCDQASFVGLINRAMRRDPDTVEFLNFRNIAGVPVTTTGVFHEPHTSEILARINPDDVLAYAVTNYELPSVTDKGDGEYRIMGRSVFVSTDEDPAKQARDALDQARRLIALAKHLNPDA